MADSSTGGYLPQTTTTDSNLTEFFHDMLQGMTGIDSNLIRPLWQANPPNAPENGVDWLAYGITNKTQDENAYIETLVDASSNLYRNEEIEVSIQIYGSSHLLTASVIKDCLEIGQNREALYLNNMAYLGTSETFNVPEIINGQYFNRCDLTLNFRRKVKRTFAILSLVDAQGSIEPDPEDLGTTTFDSVIP